MVDSAGGPQSDSIRAPGGPCSDFSASDRANDQRTLKDVLTMDRPLHVLHRDHLPHARASSRATTSADLVHDSRSNHLATKHQIGDTTNQLDTVADHSGTESLDGQPLASTSAVVERRESATDTEHTVAESTAGYAIVSVTDGNESGGTSSDHLAIFRSRSAETGLACDESALRQRTALKDRQAAITTDSTERGPVVKRPSFAPNSFLSLQSHPWLETIPASPLSPPPLTRSHTSPQMQPTLLASAPVPPVSLSIIPPTAGPDESAFATPPPHHVYQHPRHAMSAPQLSISIPVEAPLFGQVESIVAPPKATCAVAQQTAHLTRPDDERLYHALYELVETEKGYSDHLKTLVRVYFQTLPFLSLFTMTEVETILRNADALLDLHERITARIEQAELLLNWKQDRTDVDVPHGVRVHQAAGRVARILTDEATNFRVYDTYCARHGEAMDLVRSVSSRPEWEAFERQCGRVSQAGDTTPLASIVASPFFSSTPTLVGSQPTSPVLATDPMLPNRASLDASHPMPPPPLDPPASPRSRLRFADFAIAPVQRVCRYPLLLAAVLKHMEHGQDKDDVAEALASLKQVCEDVDNAKRAREGELRTRIVASRMEFLSPMTSAFCNILGPTLLVGTLHFLHRGVASEPLRIKYYGCFLYRSHLVVCKIKRRLSYEPREWLPLRLFELVNIEEGEGLLPHSFRLSHGEHVFEFGATCSAEKTIWLNKLSAVQTQAVQTWLDRDPDDTSALDESVISSVAFSATPHLRNHSRSSSYASTSVGHERTPDEVFAQMESPVMAIAPALPSQSASVSKSNRISATASALLGRTPAVQRAAIDLRLSDGVFSEELTAARAQALRDGDAMTMSRTPSGRTRTSSGPKRSMTAQAHASIKLLGRDKRRMSCYDLTVDGSPTDDNRLAAVGFDADAGVLYSEAPEKRWGASIRKSKSSAGKARPALPEIDTRLASSTRFSGPRSASIIRRAASHSELGSRPPSTPKMPSQKTAEVERNNSVSSTASSSGTGTNSSSSHGPAGASAYSDETPPSSIPPSPDCHVIDIDQLHVRLPGGKPVSSRWSTQSFGDALKLKRRKSQFGSGSLPATTASSPETPTLALPADLHRPPSHKLGGFFTKRVQSSPTLSNLFMHSGQAMSSGMSSSAASSTVSLSTMSVSSMIDANAASRRAILTSASSPSLTISASSPLDSPSYDIESSTSGSGTSSPEITLYPRARGHSKASRGALDSMRSAVGMSSFSTSSADTSSDARLGTSSSTTTPRPQNKSMRSLFKLTPIH